MVGVGRRARKSIRATFMPASRRTVMASSEDVAGPRLQTISARRVPVSRRVCSGVLAAGRVAVGRSPTTTDVMR